jgi:hypothetical protein
MTRRPYIEHCPVCPYAGDIEPLHTERDGPDGVNATYRCPKCRHFWGTSWLREPTSREY